MLQRKHQTRLLRWAIIIVIISEPYPIDHVSAERGMDHNVQRKFTEVRLVYLKLMWAQQRNGLVFGCNYQYDGPSDASLRSGAHAT